MTSGLSGSELAVLAAVSVLTVFLFPAMQGPYCVVHGPVTALQAARGAARVRFAIALAAKKLADRRNISPLAVLFWIPAPVAEFRPLNLAECDGVLRC